MTTMGHTEPDPTPQPRRESRDRLLVNVGSNLAYFAIAVGVGIWQMPYLYHRVGLTAFGQIGVFRAITNYASLFTFAMMTTVARFISIDLGKKGEDHAVCVFNTALFVLLAACAVVFGLALVMRPWVAVLVKSPPGLEHDAATLFILLIGASCVNAVSRPFASIPFARHRFDLTNMARTLGMALQVVVIVLCFTQVAHRIAFVGLAYVAKETCILLCAAVFAKRLLPRLRISLKAVRREAFDQMIRMSFWITIDRLGFLLYFSTDLILINTFIGSDACGWYSPMTQLAFLLGMVAVAVVNVFWPIAYELIAQSKIAELARHTRRTTKFVGLFLALPIGWLCGMGGSVLRVWLGPEWERLGPLLFLLIAPSVLNFSVSHMTSIFQGMNRSRTLAMTTLSGGALNVVLSILFLKFTALGIYGVAIATVIAQTLRYVLLIPMLTASLLKEPRTSFFGNMVPGAMAAALLILLGTIAQHFATISSYPALFVTAVAATLIHAALCLTLFLSHEDRRFFLSLLGRQLTRR